MKTKSILAALLLIVAGVQTTRAQKMRVNLANGETVVYKVEQVESVTFDDGTASPEYVDLGLPSGTLWATFNVGATCPEEYGDYFAWGETRPKSSYTQDNYTFSVGNVKELPAANDAATVNWGREWKMPSYAQAMELIDDMNTTKERKTQDGVDGMKVTSKINGKSIFLPLAGYMEYETLGTEGERSLFWTRSIDPDNSDYAFYCHLWSPGGSVYSYYRYRGLSVRPVSSAETNPILVSSIELNETSLTLNVEETALLKATVHPEYADNKKVWWESSDANVARVSIGGLVMAFGPGTCTITCHADDESDVEAECQVTVLASHEYVDLGLPSGTLWATCNVGADDPEDYGDYFAWGETQPKSDYSWSSYKWMTEGQANWQYINKYTFEDNQKTGCWYDGDTFIGDGKKELLPADDAATANWGSNWQTPSIEQCEELMNEAYTTATWTTQNGVAGMKITGKNGNSIFLPAGGSMNGTSLVNDGNNAQYWSRSLYARYSDYGFNMFASSNAFDKTGISRYYGHCIRPVRVKANTSDYDYVEIGGVKWATMNVGATTVAGSYETCYGDYFAWSETEPRYTSITRMSASEATFTWKSDFSSGHSYDSPNYVGTTLDEAHDAATAKWGDSWRTPTVEDFEALAKACSGFVTNAQRPVELINTITEGGIYWLSSTQTIESAYTGVAGLLFVSKADINKRVFFPATGRVNDTSLNNGGSCGTYWSSSRFQSTGAAYHLYFNSSAVSPSSNYAFRGGQTVRAVRK